MNQTKINLLEETFKNPFNIDSFRRFTREFFNEPEMLRESRRIGIPREYTDHINAYYTLAKYEDSEANGIIVLAVELKRYTSIDRARSMQRNFVSKILDDENLEAAIVAFYTEEEPSWRLSFVRLDYTFTEKGLDIDLTPARRYSYLVGKNEPNHTARTQLLPIFQDDKHNPSLDEIEDAFSVEKVTRDFFTEYKEKYLDLKEFLEKDNAFIEETKSLGFEVDKFAEQFAKKLMGQLAFLYFLQKKGWLGVRIVPKEIIKEDLTLVYNSLDKVKKDILEKVYTKTGESTYTLNIELISSKDFTDHEAELLSDIFIKNEKFDKPWGSGSRQFMRKILWEHCERNNRNFFNDYLEPFFYDALNKKRKNHYFKSFNSKIPFLNGGLFEPMEGYHWKDVNFEIPNYIFSNKKEKDRKADGILDIFDRFNFTINEAEPLEKDIAVDPEMLGKIFEELLEVSDRKSKGAFYTPREIVHYMCQESLINHLVNEVGVPYEDMKEFILYGELIRDADNRRNVGYGKEFTIKESILNNISEIDDALKNVRVADPAVGSGAFPLGMLNEIVRARNNITEYIIRKDKEGAFGERFGEEFIRNRRSSYKMKLDTIKDSIFAVDIEPSAIDITKLRLWLSIVVDQEIDGNNKDPNPLPNLDMNIQVGNSLIDEYEGIKLFDKSILENKKKDEKKKNQKIEQMRLFFNSDEILNEMFDKQSQYFAEGNEYNKQYLKSRIDELRDQLIMQRSREAGNSQAIEKYKEIKKEKTKPYFIWELEFAKVFKEKGGFDIVIGNPPYVKEYTNSDIFKPLKSNKYYQGKMDFWYFFACIGLDILHEKGIQIFIAPNNWITNAGASKLRNKILMETEIKSFVDFGKYQVFDTASIQTMIYLVKKEKELNENYITNYLRLNKEISNSDELKEFLYDADLINKNKVNPIHFIDEYITFHSEDVSQVINKMQNRDINKNILYLQNDEVAQGIVAPQEDLNKKNQIKLGNNFEVGEGIFVLSNKECNDGRFSREDKEALLRPFFTSKELFKYKGLTDNKYNIIYTKSDINKTIDKYITVKQHLDKYKNIITSSNKPYGLHRARNENIFKGTKIISIRKCEEPTFTYVNYDSYVSQTFNIIKTKRIDMVYLTGLLNSKLIKFWLKHMGKMQGNNYQVDKEPLMKIPILAENDIKYQNVINLTNQIIKETSFDERLQLVSLQEEIDRNIYNIYQLTDDEIEIVENYFKEKE